MHYVKIIAVTASVAMLAGCSKMLYKPQINEVKRIAVVSAYMNRKFYDVNQVEQQEQSAAKNLLRATVGKKAVKALADRGIDLGEHYEAILAHGHTAFVKVIDDMPSWEVMETERVAENPTVASLLENPVDKEDVQNVKNEKFKGMMAKMANAAVKMSQTSLEGQYMPYPGLKVIPIDNAYQSGTHIRMGDAGKTTQEKTREILAQVARELGVDAVALLDLDMGYRFGRLVKLKIAGELMATPVVNARVLLVTSKGEVAMHAAGFGPAEGKGMRMIHKGYISFHRRGDKIVANYQNAIDELAGVLKKKLKKAVAKL